MQFNFTLYNMGKTFQMTAERDEETAVLETWKVYNSANPGAFLQLQNNRPLLHSKRLYTKRWEWKVLSGNIRYPQMLEQTKTQIEYHINDQQRIKIQTRKKIK